MSTNAARWVQAAAARGAVGPQSRFPCQLAADGAATALRCKQTRCAATPLPARRSPVSLQPLQRVCWRWPGATRHTGCSPLERCEAAGRRAASASGPAQECELLAAAADARVGDPRPQFTRQPPTCSRPSGVSRHTRTARVHTKSRKWPTSCNSKQRRPGALAASHGMPARYPTIVAMPTHGDKHREGGFRRKLLRRAAGRRLATAVQWHHGADGPGVERCAACRLQERDEVAGAAAAAASQPSCSSKWGRWHTAPQA